MGDYCKSTTDRETTLAKAPNLRTTTHPAVAENFLGFYCVNPHSTSLSKHLSVRDDISFVSSKSYCEFQTIDQLVLDHCQPGTEAALKLRRPDRGKEQKLNKLDPLQMFVSFLSSR